MTKLNLLALGATALALAGCNQGADNATSAPGNGASAAAVAPPAGQDWAQVVSATPEGGFVKGNPNAPVKLVEYVSLTCGHCADFAKTGYPKLDEYVRKGTVSVELRNYVRDAVDMTATLVSRCGGPQTYFAMTEQALAQQAQIGQRLSQLPASEQTRLNGLQPPAVFQALAPVAGLDQFARQRGIPQGQLDGCLTNKADIDKLVAMVQTANAIPGFVGTPTFLINGTRAEAGTWEALEPLLKQAGA